MPIPDDCTKKALQSKYDNGWLFRGGYRIGGFRPYPHCADMDLKRQSEIQGVITELIKQDKEGVAAM